MSSNFSDRPRSHKSREATLEAGERAAGSRVTNKPSPSPDSASTPVPDPTEPELSGQAPRSARERARGRARTVRVAKVPAQVEVTIEDSPRVLVVDDSATFRRAIGSMLSRAGFTIETASSGEEAFERCLNEQFSVVVSDVTMGALSGVQLCRLLRSDPGTKDLPVVLLTAADDPRSRFWGRNAGAAAYVAKENARDELVREVRQVMSRGCVSLLPVSPRAGRRLQPMGRLSQVLDELLFRAVVASEVQRLMHHTNDRTQFARELASLASDITDYAYLAIQLPGKEQHSLTIHARGPFPAEMNEDTLRALGLSTTPPTAVDVIAEDVPRPDAYTLQIRDHAHFPIRAADEILGDLHAYGSGKRLGGDDRATLELLAQQCALLVKNMRLLEETRRLADNDGLTGLQNRRRTSERLDSEVARARRYGTSLCIALIDIDHFKSVNDTFGHNMGDQVLRTVARSLADSVRNVDLVGRWGGEEFLVLLPETKDGGCQVVAERLRKSVEGLPAFSGGPSQITCSIGVAAFADDPGSAAYVDRADRALYEAKRAGRNRVIHDETNLKV